MKKDRSDDKAHIIWAQQVKERDNYTCQICGKSGVWLNSHHLNSYSLFPGQRYHVGNGTTLCRRDHDMYHSIYGKGMNTVYQFEEFKKSCEIIKQAILKNNSTIEKPDGYG